MNSTENSLDTKILNAFGSDLKGNVLVVIIFVLYLSNYALYTNNIIHKSVSDNIKSFERINNVSFNCGSRLLQANVVLAFTYFVYIILLSRHRSLTRMV